MKKEEIDDEIIPVKESDFMAMLKLMDDVFTTETIEKIDNFISMSNMDTAERFYYKISNFIYLKC